MSLKVFLSYAKEDAELARKYYTRFLEEGVIPWMDEKNILPGQNWDVAINKALGDANLIVLLLSNQSVNKRGFVQREFYYALERLKDKLPDDIYVIPLLLEPCDIPAHIAERLQYIELNTEGAWSRVQASLKIAADQQSIQIAMGSDAGPFRVFTKMLEDQWHGTPGHDIQIEYPMFESAQLSSMADELSLYFSGRAARVLIESRQNPWDQSPDLYPKIDEFTSMKCRWDNFGIIYATPKVLSLVYEVGWYGAGAAHPNVVFDTYNFVIQDRLYLLHFQDIFKDKAGAIKRISDLCVAALCKEYWSRTGEKPDEGQLEWFQKGAGPTPENFTSFTISADHFTFLFAPYQVSAYSMGRWSADVSFYDLLDFISDDGLHLLALPPRT